MPTYRALTVIAVLLGAVAAATASSAATADLVADGVNFTQVNGDWFVTVAYSDDNSDDQGSYDFDVVIEHWRNGVLQSTVASLTIELDREAPGLIKCSGGGPCSQSCSEKVDTVLTYGTCRGFLCDCRVSHAKSANIDVNAQTGDVYKLVLSTSDVTETSTTNNTAQATF